MQVNMQIDKVRQRKKKELTDRHLPAIIALCMISQSSILTHLMRLVCDAKAAKCYPAEAHIIQTENIPNCVLSATSAVFSVHEQRARMGMQCRKMMCTWSMQRERKRE